MRVFYENGIVVQDGIKEVILDPVRPMPGSIVSHGHMDHLTEGGVMTPETLEILKIRKRSSKGTVLPYNRERELNGFRVRLRDAGHVFGSAMIRVDDVLYTGDVNPEGGVTCGKAVPERCSTLVIEATYGRPYLNFPPKHIVESDLLNWVEFELSEGPVALGGYEFGKAQELIALVNRLKVEVAVTDRIAEIADAYRKGGMKLQYRRISELSEGERKDPRVYVLPRGWLRPPLEESVSWLGQVGLRTAYCSGWCTIYDFTRSYGLDAQFPLSDHADFDDLIAFVAESRPKRVYTVYSHPVELAKEIERRLRIPAHPLNVKRST